MTTDTTLAERLLNSAEGSYTSEAAALIITQAIQGTLPDKLTPAITDHPDIGRAFIDWKHTLEISTSFSSGEQRIITLAASLATNNDVNLGDALTGLDETNARIVLEGLAHGLRIRL